MKRVAIVLCLLFVSAAAIAGTVGTYTPMTGTVNWASIQLMREVETVANEIALVVNGAPGMRDTNNVGTNAASAANTMTNLWTYREMQDMILSEYDELWYGAEALEGKTNFYALSALGGSGTYENQFYLLNFYAYVGISSNGFRRAVTNWPSNWTNLNDAAYSYGTMQAGDIVGPWILDDIQRCFDGMSRSVEEAAWYNDGTSITYYGESESAYTNWNDLVAQVTANWASPDNVQSNNVQPSHFAFEDYSTTSEEWDLDVGAGRGKSRHLVSGLGVFRVVEFYQRSQKSTASGPRIVTVFDDNGDDVLENTWHKWDVVTNTPASSSEYVWSDLYLGSLDLPNISGASSTNRIYRGWFTGSKYYLNSANPNRPVVIQNFEWSYTRE